MCWSRSWRKYGWTHSNRWNGVVGLREAWFARRPPIMSATLAEEDWPGICFVLCTSCVFEVVAKAINNLQGPVGLECTTITLNRLCSESGTKGSLWCLAQLQDTGLDNSTIDVQTIIYVDIRGWMFRRMLLQKEPDFKECQSVDPCKGLVRGFF